MVVHVVTELLVRRANARRRALPSRGSLAAVLLEALFRPSERLATYGSLAPGRQNHHVVAPLGGEWRTGYVEGDLHAEGWGAGMGFPALRWRPRGGRVPVQLLISPRLPGAWPALDAFEGADYRRALIPVYDDRPGARRVMAVANIYESRVPARRSLA
jgi:gamma-glutamylcyclotransferase (GGCT)/AIG2-like uncharacterized protein YtfP